MKNLFLAFAGVALLFGSQGAFACKDGKSCAKEGKHCDGHRAGAKCKQCDSGKCPMKENKEGADAKTTDEVAPPVKK